MTFGIAKKFTPRGVALFASAATTLLVTLVLTWFIAQGLTPPVLQRLDLFIHDNWVRSTLHFTGTPKVTLLALDEASLQKIGQWPWPRDRIAQVVQAVIDQHGARAIAFDMVFAEPDRSDADRIRERLARTPGAQGSALGAQMQDLLIELDRDAALARVLEGRPVVLGHYFTNDASQRVGALPDPWLPADIAHQSGVFPPRGDGYGANLESLVHAAGRAGHMNPSVDADGVTRRLPLLIENEGMLYPSLMLAALTIVAGDQAQVDFGQATTLRGQPVTETITLGPYRLPIDGQARSMLPFFGARGSVPTVSVLDMLEGRMPPDLMRGRVVVFGPTAPGLRDSRATPVDTNQPGTELHVSWLQGALDARLPSRPHYTDATVLTLVWCVALGMLAGAWRLRPARFVATATALALGVWTLGWWLWRQDRLVLPVALPQAAPRNATDRVPRARRVPLEGAVTMLRIGIASRSRKLLPSSLLPGTIGVTGTR
jgi:adenylate cyclase